MSNLSHTSVLVLLFAFGLTPMAALANGASLAKDKCVTCHTESGNSQDEKIPNIAGFSAVTIQDMVTAYKEGDRIGVKYTPEGGKESDMNEIAENLNDQDLQAISQYYASKTFEKRTNTTDPKLVSAGAKLHKKKCEKCHSDGGTNADDDAAILSGQWMAYLKKEFDNIRSGDRIMPKKMMKKMKKLDDSDIEKLLHFYSAGQ